MPRLDLSGAGEGHGLSWRNSPLHSDEQWHASTKGSPELVAEARNIDISCARQNHLSVIRADVAGRTPALVSYGSSSIIDPRGLLLGAAQAFATGLIVADIESVVTSDSFV